MAFLIYRIMESIFYKGQKIVAIRDRSRKLFKKGDEFVVLDIQKPCCNFLIQIFNNIRHGVDCSFCGMKHDNLKGYFSEIMFSPIQEKYEFTYNEAVELVTNRIIILN